MHASSSSTARPQNGTYMSEYLPAKTRRVVGRRNGAMRPIFSQAHEPSLSSRGRPSIHGQWGPTAHGYDSFNERGPPVTPAPTGYEKPFAPYPLIRERRCTRQLQPWPTLVITQASDDDRSEIFRRNCYPNASAWLRKRETRDRCRVGQSMDATDEDDGEEQGFCPYRILIYSSMIREHAPF